MDETQLGEQFVATVISTADPEAADEAARERSTVDGAPAAAACGFERYRLGRVIGEGGMGRVVEAEDRQFGRMVALKSMRASGEAGDRERRFGLEAVVTANLDHPGIPAVYERGRDQDDNPFYAMRLVRGRSLRDAIDQTKTLDDRLRLLPALIDVAQTLAFAHARGVIHRDIKPDNVVVGAYGDTVVIDWGVAKLRGVGASVSDVSSAISGEPGHSRGGGTETQHGSVIGTPAYMAPEQAAGRVEEVDERSDVFSLGALLYHLFCGHPPYRGRGSMAVVARAIEAEFEPLSSVAPDVPAAILAIVERAMAREPDDRYASAGQLAEALQEVVAAGVRQKGSRAVRVFADATSGILTVFMLLIVVVMLVSMPLENLGIHRFVLLPIFAAGAGLAVVEWWTLGRYRLSALIIGLAVALALQGLVMSGMGEIEMFFAIGEGLEHGTLADDDLALAFTRGSQILAQGEVVSFQLAAALIVLWSVARYRIGRSSSGGATMPSV